MVPFAWNSKILLTTLLTGLSRKPAVPRMSKEASMLISLSESLMEPSLLNLKVCPNASRFSVCT